MKSERIAEVFLCKITFINTALKSFFLIKWGKKIKHFILNYFLVPQKHEKKLSSSFPLISDSKWIFYVL